MRITLNLATRPYADLGPALKRLRIAMAVLIAIGIGLGLGLRAFHQKAEEARATEERVQNQIDAINRERQGYTEMMRQPSNAELLVQAGALNQIFDEKTFSWTLAMEDLETVLPGGVQVITIDPVRDAKSGKITLKLRVAGPRDRADDLVENLEHSKHFLLPRIVGENTESGGGPNQRLEPVSASNRVNFELLADYNSAVLADRKAEKMQENEKSSADGEHASQPAPAAAKSAAGPATPPHAARPLPPPAAGKPPIRPPVGGPAQPQRVPGQPPARLHFAVPAQAKPNAGPNAGTNPNLNPGGPR